MAHTIAIAVAVAAKGNGGTLIVAVEKTAEKSDRPATHGQLFGRASPHIPGTVVGPVLKAWRVVEGDVFKLLVVRFDDNYLYLSAKKLIGTLVKGRRAVLVYGNLVLLDVYL